MVEWSCQGTFRRSLDSMKVRLRTPRRFSNLSLSYIHYLLIQLNMQFSSAEVILLQIMIRFNEFSSESQLHVPFLLEPSGFWQSIYPGSWYGRHLCILLFLPPILTGILRLRLYQRDSHF